MLDPSDVTAVERSTRAVTAIGQVVQAIWALSRAQLPLVEEAASAAVAYQHAVDRVIDRVAGRPLEARAGERLFVVFGPERPYSAALARRMLEAIPEEGAIGVVGQRLAEAIAIEPSLDARVRFRSSGSVAHDDLHEIAYAVAAQILEHGTSAEVVILYPSESGVERAPLIVARAAVEHPPETFSSLGVVLGVAVEAAMAGRLAVAAVETLRAEVRARMVAADAARQACRDKLTELEELWHTGRRETITRELLEIVAGREALAG